MSFVSLKPTLLAAVVAGVMAVSLQADAPAPKGSGPLLPNPLVMPKEASKPKPRIDPATQLDINLASRDALMKLGLDAKTAEKIIAGRPYLTKTKLVTNKVIPGDVFAGIKDRIKVVIKDPIKAIAQEKAAHHPKA